MAIALRDHTDISSGALDARSTQLKNDAKIAYALFTGIVKNKIGYAIREYAKNAWEVSPPGKPFIVELPSRWSARFRIRDFGPGLSHHFMMNRYAQLGDSTKDTNGVTGVSGWGFGSKSALAYLMEDGMSGSYAVISYRSGEANHYIISLDQRGMPQTKHFMSVPTEEHDGLEVSFAVREDDFDAFEELAREILWSFEPRPTVNPDLNFREPVETARGTGWVSFQPASVPFSGPQVRVGPVMYPIDMKEISGSIGFLQPGDTIIFDVAEESVSPTASREQLQYTSGTKKALSAMIAAYEQNFVAEVQTKVDAATCYFGGCAEFQKATSHLGTSRYSGIREKVSWGGQPIRTGIAGKTMHLRKGWAGFDRFRGETVDPARVAEAKVVIEHSPYASLDRFLALDLVGDEILWARVKKDELPGFLEMCALKTDDVVILDTAPLEKRPNYQVGTRTNQIRRRRTLTITPFPADRMTPIRLNEGTNTVDLEAGGIKLRKVSSWSGRRKDSYNIGGSYNVMRESSFEDFLEKFMRLGLLDKPLQILIDTGVDDLSDEWSDFGDYAALRLGDIIDETKLTPIQTMTGSTSLRNDAVKFAALNLDKAPQEFRDFCTQLRGAERSITRSERVENDHDKAFNVLRLIDSSKNFPSSDAGVSPAEAVNAKFQSIRKRYPIIDVIQNNVWNARDRQEYFDHYFTLISNQK